MRVLSIAAFTALVSVALAQASVNPCPSNKKAEAANGCEHVKIPEGMCKACPLNKPQNNGEFANCQNIFNLDAPSCKAKLEEYVAKNPCDTVRKALVNEWSAASKKRLDYFAYSLCEQCCDNVPKGSKVEEYSWRNNGKNMKLWSLTRGNGPAHFHYDICAIFPNFKSWVLPWSGYDVYTRPKLCPQLQSWLDSDASKNWVQNENAAMSNDITTGISDAMWALQCHNYEVWTRCVDLESKQKRV